MRARFQWQGMMDSYISYITLARAVKIFSKYGEAQVLKDFSYSSTDFFQFYCSICYADGVLLCNLGERPH